MQRSQSLNRYFRRVGFTDSARADLQTLRKLHQAHLRTVPFENLDVQLGRELDIDPEAAFEKIVERGRGGWCYEQNGLFGWVLGEIGFDVTRIAAAVMRAERGSQSLANHLCLQVRLPDTSSEYLVDVGFGGSLYQPIEMRVAEHDQEPFRLGLRGLADGHWQFFEDLGKGEFSYDFEPLPADESALARKCRQLQTDPESGFVLNLVAQIRGPDWHKTLRGRVLTMAKGSDGTSTQIQTADEMISVLATDFGIDVPAAAELWPKVEERHAALFPETPVAD